jgi:uncharacterized membrane protein
MPAIFYNYGSREYGAEVTRRAERVSRAGQLGEDGLVALMRDVGADYIYLGPVAAAHDGGLTVARLAQLSALERVFDQDGVVIFRLRDDAGASQPATKDQP